MRVFFSGLFCLCIINASGQVSLQTGSATYEVPIFSHTDSKSGLATSISLAYSSRSGLVVNERASNVGQGWNLLAGGAIVRKQNGEPDDQNSTSLFPVIPNASYRGFNESNAYYHENYQSHPYAGDPYSRDYVDNYFPNGFMYSEFPYDMTETYPLKNSVPWELALNPRFHTSMDKRYKLSRRALTDRQQDVFIFSVGNETGEFIIGKDGIPVTINNSRLQIQYVTENMLALDIRTRIKEFTIKTTGGVLYRFATVELSENMHFKEVSSEGNNEFRKVISSSDPTGKYTIQKWLLTEIINPLTQEKILFEYDPYYLDCITDRIPSYQFTEGQSAELVQIYEQRSKGTLKRLKNIIFPDGYKIELIYYPFSRADLPGDDPVEKINVVYETQLLTSIQFTYGHFVRKEIRDYPFPSIPEADKRFARLCLKEIQKTGIGINEPPYIFNYYTGSESGDVKDIVPPLDCAAQDHWGYYNKAAIVDNEIASPSKEVYKNLMLNAATHRQPFTGAAQLGLLKSVQNPLGGKLTFEYEQNESKDADNPGLTKVMGGVRVSKTIVHDGVSINNDILTNYYYRLEDETTSGWGYESPNYFQSQTIRIIKDMSGYTKEGVQKLDLTAELSKVVLKLASNELIRLGARMAVRQVIYLAKVAAKEISADVAVNSLPLPQLSFGGSLAVAYAAFVIGKMIDGIFLLFDPYDYLTSNSYSFLPIEAQIPIGLRYSRVEVANTSVTGGLGRTVYEFKAPANVRNEIPVLAPPFGGKDRFPGWKYGYPTRTLIYTQSGGLISETTNSYNFISSPLQNTNHKSCKVLAIRPESAPTYYAGTFPLTDFSWEDYYPVTGRLEPLSTTTKLYSPSGQMAESIETIAYNTDYLPKTSSTTKSNGDIITTKTYYPNDYNNISTAIQELKTRNMIAVPVSTETWLTKPGGTEYLLDATINQFGIIANGEIKIEKIYRLETKQPLLKSLIGEQSPAVLVRNTTYFKEKVNFAYDNNGILVATTTPEMRINSKVYDYNSRVVVADVENASRNEVAYSSFETTQTNGWTYSQSYVATGASVTGKKYFSFPANNQSAVISKPLLFAGNTFRLSFWTRGNDLTVYNDEVVISPVKTVANPVSGWTYKEYVFTTTAVPIVYIYNYGSTVADIDEVRLCPVNARMSTVAYDPKVGKIAECDVNNRILYYEYDGLGRIKHVRDDRQNILKKYCYNYAGEAENCIDLADTSPQWRPLQNTMCENCPSDYNYNSGVLLRMEQDMNTQSVTYGHIRWVPDPAGSCPTASWTITYTYCEALLVPPYGNTGYQIDVYTDMNPCSATYNQTQEIRTYNPASCPPTVVCNPPCNTPQYKCINGQCVQGTWQVVEVVKLGKFGPWECTWAWCYPDGTFDRPSSQVVTSSTACFVTCN